MNIVLYEPEIPQNTGNIARTCVLTACTLHLIEPLGFSLADRQLKRAGLDYWPLLSLVTHPSWAAFQQHRAGRGKLYCLSAKGNTRYSDVRYAAGDYLVFGRETAGLPETILRQGTVLRVPMLAGVNRSLNLSNAVAIVLFEALRQRRFPRMV